MHKVKEIMLSNVTYFSGLTNRPTDQTADRTNERMFILIFKLKTICDYYMLEENPKMQHARKHPRINFSHHQTHQAPKYEQE
jgi:hypothetical protein